MTASTRATGASAGAIPAHVAEQALNWLLALQAGEASEQDWQHWRQAHPTHEQAWQRIEQLNQRLRPLRQNPASQLAHTTLTQPARANRRKLLASATVLALVGAGAWVTAHPPAPLRLLLAEHRTGRGERRPLMLPDGTRLTLNSDTALDVDFDAHARRVVLLRGELLIETAHDARPFSILTPQGEAQALGTRYLVRSQPEASRVDVFEGQVRLVPRQSPGSAQVLQAGERRQLHADHLGPSEAADPLAAAWRDGMLVARQLRLADFVAELDRHSATPLHCDPAVSELRLSGSYPLSDVPRILHTVAGVLPIRVDTTTGRWGRREIHLRAR